MIQRPLARSLLLVGAAAAIVGWGCIVIPIPADKDTTAESIYRPKAEQGDAVAQLQLALAYRFGTAGVGKNPQEAWRWLNKSAASGNVEARTMVAEALWRGDLGQPRQPELALTQLRALAENGTPDQQARLAGLLEGDFGGEPRYTEAAQWYEKAARRGHRYGAQRLGRLYEAGQGRAKDPVAALAWYRIARAEADSERLQRSLSRADIDRAAALQRRLMAEGTS